MTIMREILRMRWNCCHHSSAKNLYPVLGAERLAEIFSYLETPTQYLSELSINQAAKIVSFMDSDDAVDILEQMEASAKEKIVTLMDADSSHDIRLILSYDEDEIGSMMTTNFVAIRKDLSIRQAHAGTGDAGR